MHITDLKVFILIGIYYLFIYKKIKRRNYIYENIFSE